MSRKYSARGSSEEEKRIFAERLNHYIYLSGKTQAQVAKELGFNQTTLNMWCNGNSMPSSGKIQKIAEYFHVDRSDLIEKKDGYESSQFKELMNAAREATDSEIEIATRVLNVLREERERLFRMMDTSMDNLKNGVASKPIDLSDSSD